MILKIFKKMMKIWYYFWDPSWLFTKINKIVDQSLKKSVTKEDFLLEHNDKIEFGK